jgi:hypothetical protein
VLELLPKTDLLGKLGQPFGDGGGLLAILPDVFALGLLLEIG